VTNFVALGQRLRDAREAKEFVARRCRARHPIRARFIEQMERGDYSGMTPVQPRAFCATTRASSASILICWPRN